MKLITIFIFCLSFTFFSCTKKKTTNAGDKPTVTTDLKPGFPDNLRAINGYFYAQVQQYNGSNGYYFSSYCVSSDPARNLMASYDHYEQSTVFNSPGNVDIGPILFNDITLNARNSGISINYQFINSFAFLALPSPVSWKTTGNGSFKALDITVARGFPLIVNTYTNTSQGYSLSLSNGYTVNFGDFVSNYDSLIISLESYGSVIAKKKRTPGITSVNFSSVDLSTLPSGSDATLNIYAYNYSNKTIENVCNVFELSNKLSVYIQVLP